MELQANRAVFSMGSATISLLQLQYRTPIEVIAWHALENES